MKKSIEIEKFDFKELSLSELTAIEGGRGFWGDVAYGIGATVHFIGYMLVDAHTNPIRPSEYR